MSLSETVLRTTTNKALQQALRYYIQYGPRHSASMALQRSMTQLAGPSVEKYLDRKSLYRNELFLIVPETRIWYYDSPERLSIDEPLHFGPLPATFRKSVGTFHRAQPFVCEVDDVVLAGPTANPKTVDGRYIRDAQSLAQDQFFQSILIEKLARSNSADSPAERVNDGVVFTNLWSTNHYHWQLDFLPRLRGVEEYRRERGKEPTLIIGPDPPSWQKEYLALLGYGPADWCEYNGKRLSVDTLVVPYSVRFKRSQIEWVRDRLFERVPPEPENTPSNIYISRADALCRRVLNEDELMEVLYDEGFTKVELGKMSIESQIRLFANADTVIGPHGAGFANLMYAEDASVIELFGVKEGPSTFNLAGVLDHTYACLRCETRGEDLVVDTDEVIAMLEML